MGNVPKIRFEGYTDEWEQRRLCEYLDVSSEKNKDDIFTKQDVLSVSGDFGVVNQISFQGRSYAGVNVSNYGIVQTGDVVYTKSPLKSNPYGIIKVNKGQPGIVSTLYAVYHPRKNVVPDFVQTYFEQNARMNNYIHPLANKGAKNDMKISAENALKGLVCFPNVAEQRQMVELFSQLDTTIDSYQRKRNTLERAKQYFLQNMFPRNGERVPQIRFDGFSDDWEQHRLEEIAEIIGGGTPDTNNPAYWDGNIDWYAPAEMEGQRYAFGSVRKITELGLQRSSAKILPAGRTVLFTSRAGIGKMTILQRPGATNQGFQSLVLKDGIDPYFIYSMGNQIKEMAERVAAGSTFSEISGKKLGNLEVMIPSFCEQKEVAGFFRRIDDLIMFYLRKCEQLNLLKHFLLKNMFV